MANGSTAHGIALSDHCVQYRSPIALPETQGRWLEVANSDQVERVITSVRETLPSGGTSLYNAFEFLNELDSKPDNIFIITDGLPTQGRDTPRKNTVSGSSLPGTLPRCYR